MDYSLSYSHRGIIHTKLLLYTNSGGVRHRVLKSTGAVTGHANLMQPYEDAMETLPDLTHLDIVTGSSDVSTELSKWSISEA